MVELAADLGAALIGITHFTKGTSGRDPLERVTGSLAFGALARIVMATAKKEDEDGKTTRVLARAKSNIGLDHGGFEYDIETIEAMPGLFASRVIWGNVIDGAARDILGNPDENNGEEGEALKEARDWLREYLTHHGTKNAKEITAEAKGFGIADRTLRRARKSLNIKPSKIGMTGGWYWSLPAEESEDGHENMNMAIQNSMDTFD
jgi:putative DNA primase/helicase